MFESSADFRLCLHKFCGEADRGRLAWQRREFKTYRKSTAQSPRLYNFALHDNASSGGIINTEKRKGIASPGDIGKGMKSDKEAKELYERLLGDSKRSFVGSS